MTMTGAPRSPPEGPSRQLATSSVAYVVSMRTGLHSFVFREIQQLRQRGTEVVVLAISRGQGPYMPDPEWPTEFPRALNVLRGFIRILRRRRGTLLPALMDALSTRSLVDLGLALSLLPVLHVYPVQSIHAHFGDHKLFTADYLHQLTGLPLTVTIHAYELYSNPNPLMFRRSLSHCSAIITVSNYNREILERDYGIPAHLIKVIHLFPGLIPEILPPMETRNFSILCVARFVPKKAHDVLLRALKEIIENGHADVRLTLVGSGPVDVKGMVTRLGLATHVEIQESVSDADLQKLFREASVFCLPSRIEPTGDREGIPVAIMEAMAYGLPIVTTRSAGIPELVRGTLVPENDSKAIAEALLALKRDPYRAREEGLANREIIREHFSPSNVDELNATLRRVQHATS